jgi:hypothetical protein
MKPGDKFRLHPKGSECVVVKVEGNIITFEQPSTGIKGQVNLDVIKTVERIN